MQKHRKRKQEFQLRTSSSFPSTRLPIRSSKIDSLDLSIKEPFPSHPRPTLEECRAIRDDLLALHGFPQQFAKYRKLRHSHCDETSSLQLRSEPEALDGNHGEPSESASVLDGLVSIILSQNTTESNSQRAFASLKVAFPSWEDVLAAEPKCIENAIRCGGLAATKASCIKNILSCLSEKKGKLCLEYLHDLSVDEVKEELSDFKGVGLKTVACVLMFNLQRDDFPVDTHIFQIAKTIGWLPAEANTKTAYLHLNQRIPDELKFDLNCLLYTHGKICSKCTRKGILNKKIERLNDSYCPLLNCCLNS